MTKKFRFNMNLICCAVISIFTILFPQAACAEAAPFIVLIETFDVPVILAHTKCFLAAMTDLGYDGHAIRILKAQGDPKKAERLLKETINRHRPDLIVANATLASQVAHRISQAYKIPMVFFVVSDPVGAGIVSEINAPSEQWVTGIVHSVPRETKIEMVMRVIQTVPNDARSVRCGYIHSSYPSAKGDLRMLKKAAQKRDDIKFISYEIPYDENNFKIDVSLKHLKQGIQKLDPIIDYWWISQDPVGELEEFIKTLSKLSRHPIICGTNPESIKQGALMYIAADTKVGADETAVMVDKILKGTSAGQIPVHSPAKIDYGVNLSTALKMGVAIPSDLLALAGPNLVR